MSTTRTTAPKGTAKTEVIMGQAASKLNTGMKFLKETVVELSTMTEKIEENALIISNQEAIIAAKEQELKNKIAQDKIEIQQEFEANKKAFVEKWLADNKMAWITQDKLVELNDNLGEALKSNEDEVKKQVAIVTNTMKSDHASELRTKELEFKASEAETKAQLAQKEEKIKFLEEQVVAWKSALTEERDARVKVAQASTIQQTFTGNGK